MGMWMSPWYGPEFSGYMLRSVHILSSIWFCFHNEILTGSRSNLYVVIIWNSSVHSVFVSLQLPVVKHHDLGILQKERFIWVYNPRRLRAHDHPRGETWQQTLKVAGAASGSSYLPPQIGSIINPEMVWVLKLLEHCVPMSPFLQQGHTSWAHTNRATN